MITHISPVNGIFPTAPRDSLISLSLGNGSRFDVYVSQTPQGLLVSVLSAGPYGGAYVFAVYASGGYVAEKLRLLNGDADLMAKFINVQNS